MNTREAIVINTTTKNPILDLDPVDVELTTAGDVALPESGPLMDIFDAMIEIGWTTEGVSLVWSDDLTPVKFLCPVCDDVCEADDGAPEDLPGGLCAMVCCDCLD